MANTQLNCAFKSRKPQLIMSCWQTLQYRDCSKKLGECKEHRFNDSYWFIRWNAYNQVLLSGYWFCTLWCWFRCSSNIKMGTCKASEHFCTNSKNTDLCTNSKSWCPHLFKRKSKLEKNHWQRKFSTFLYTGKRESGYNEQNQSSI